MSQKNAGGGEGFGSGVAVTPSPRFAGSQYLSPGTRVRFALGPPSHIYAREIPLSGRGLFPLEKGCILAIPQPFDNRPRDCENLLTRTALRKCFPKREMTTCEAYSRMSTRIAEEIPEEGKSVAQERHIPVGSDPWCRGNSTHS